MIEIPPVPDSLQCVKCGYCCTVSCSLGIRLLDTNVDNNCKALYWDGKRYRCFLAEDFKEELSIGEGCCSPLNSWRKEVKQRKEVLVSG